MPDQSRQRLSLVSTHSHPKVAAPITRLRSYEMRLFQHTATRRWLRLKKAIYIRHIDVSTHSHPKVAASVGKRNADHHYVSTHSHPKVAATLQKTAFTIPIVSTHSHPKVAAAWIRACVSTLQFQHTATRRWLHRCNQHLSPRSCFNTQPPEGGCAGMRAVRLPGLPVSTHSHPKVAAADTAEAAEARLFQHTATRRWLPAPKA